MKKLCASTCAVFCLYFCWEKINIQPALIIRLWQSGIQCSHLPEFDDKVMEAQPSRIDWLKVTTQEREDYYHESKNLLDQLQLPTEVRHCQNFNCTDEKYLEEIENLYAELTSVLLAAASSAIITIGKENEGKFNIPGWKSVVKSKHQISKAAFRLWAWAQFCCKMWGDSSAWNQYSHRDDAEKTFYIIQIPNPISRGVLRAT